MKNMVVTVLAVLVFVFLASILVGQSKSLNQRISAISEANAATSEAKNVLQFPVELTMKRPAARPESANLFAVVKFSHFDHQSVPCTTCHHTWDGKGKIEGCSTAGCHDNMKSKTDSDSYFKAFHSVSSEHSCRSCHKKLTDEGKAQLTTSPCSNNACHPKKG